jgi:hypothetical protein
MPRPKNTEKPTGLLAGLRIVDLEPPVKRGRGRPKGGTNQKRVRRSEIQIALDEIGKKEPNITQALIDTIAQFQTDNERLRFLTNEYARSFAERRQSTRLLTNAIQQMAEQKAPSKSDKIGIHIFIPVDLHHEFQNILEDTPLNRNEILTNLILNYIKAHKGFSKTILQDISGDLGRLEKQEYRNTKIAAEMLENAPYDAVRTGGSGNVARKGILEESTADEEYARKVDQPYTEEGVTKAMKKSKGPTVDMSELFKKD